VVCLVPAWINDGEKPVVSYKWPCWYPDHTNVFVLFQPCNCWGLYWEIVDGPTTFHVVTAGDADGWCKKWLVWLVSCAPITPNFPSDLQPWALLGIMFRNRCWPTIFHTITAGDAKRWCQKWPVWLASHALTTPTFPSASSHAIVGDCVEK